MKLIFCPECQDVRKMRAGVPVSCQCGLSWGRYIDDLNAVYGGEAVPIGIANPSLATAIEYRPDSGAGTKFDAFVIPKHCNTCRRSGNELQ